MSKPMNIRPISEIPLEIDAQLAAHLMYNAYGLEPLPLNALDAQGLAVERLLDLDMVLVRINATFFADGGFEYDELGEAAFGFVIVGEDGTSEVDVIAWSARDATLFGTLLGSAAVIGAVNITNPASFYSGPCPLWRTQHRWLRESCAGGVVLSAIPASTLIARARGLFAAEDLEHGRELVRSGAVSPNQLVVPAHCVRAAA